MPNRLFVGQLSEWVDTRNENTNAKLMSKPMREVPYVLRMSATAEAAMLTRCSQDRLHKAEKG